MSQIINELAKIDVSDEALQQLDVDRIFRSFRENYQKLDDLKNFRSDHEKKNAVMRWWHNDKLRDAQLDSSEVQAEFSRAIGQLIIIGILQSKKLSEQQMQLNEQQEKLRTQADGIAEHANELQKQHHVLAEQSTKLETLVHEYFALKGLTEEGVQKLIEIAREVKVTKEGILQEFAIRSKELETLCVDITTEMAALSTEVNDTYKEKLELIERESSGQALLISNIVNENTRTKAELIAQIQELQDHQNTLINFQRKVSKHITHMNYAVVGLAVFALGVLGGMAYLHQWFDGILH